MNEDLQWIIDSSLSIGEDVHDAASWVFNDPRFPIWSGSSRKGQHHYGMGGLLRHTAETMRLCMSLANDEFAKYGLDKKEVFLAPLFHDCGKMWDYESFDPQDPLYPHNAHLDIKDMEWRGTPHKRLIHHISRSATEWSKACEEVALGTAIHDNVLHAILAHHTSRQAGSPVAPKTRLAWLLTLCDNLSARMNDADTWDIVSGRAGEERH